jgi:hypothetical protein
MHHRHRRRTHVEASATEATASTMEATATEATASTMEATAATLGLCVDSKER